MGNNYPEIWSRSKADHFFQLREQVYLWQASSTLALTLIEVDHLTKGIVHDMSKIAQLVDIIPETECPPHVLERLRHSQRLSYLAYANLDLLRYKIRGYERFEVPYLIKTLDATVNLLRSREAIGSKPQLTLSVGSDVKDFTVSMRLLHLQQAIYNIYHWYQAYMSTGEIVISLIPDKKAARIEFVGQPLQSTEFQQMLSLEAFEQNKPGAIYAYLAHKAVSRYNGTLQVAKHVVSLTLPIETSNIVILEGEMAGSGSQFESYLAYLDSKKTLETSLDAKQASDELHSESDLASILDALDISDRAMTFVELLAEDLLTKMDGMLNQALLDEDLVELMQLEESTIGNYWSTIERNYRFFHILISNLRKRQPVTVEDVNLERILNDVKFLLFHKVLKHDVKIKSDIDNPAIKSDRTSLYQVFLNLALNALEAMPEDGENSKLLFRIKPLDDDYVSVEVIDNGPGIPAENRSRIFDLNFTTKQKQDRGIGLYIVKTLVEDKLQGTIRVAKPHFEELQVVVNEIEQQSEVVRKAQGTVFEVKLPKNLPQQD